MYDLVWNISFDPHKFAGKLMTINQIHRSQIQIKIISSICYNHNFNLLGGLAV